MNRYMLAVFVCVAEALLMLASAWLSKALLKKDQQEKTAGRKGLSAPLLRVAEYFAADSWKTNVGTAGILLVFAVVLSVLRPTLVSGSSMDGSLYDGELLLAVAAERTDVTRGDIICLQLEEEDVLMVKRVIGMPGDYICLCRGKLMVNGRTLYENYIKEPMQQENVCYARRLGEGEYFVLGDNRNVSRDSRSFGSVRREEIKSVAKCGIGRWGIELFRQPEVLAQLEELAVMQAAH